MDKLDRLDWAAGMSFSAYGLKIGVRANTPAALELVTPHMPPYSRPIEPGGVVDRLYSFVLGGGDPTANVRRYHLVYSEAFRLARTMDLGEALRSLEFDLQVFIADLAPRRVFVHAGVVTWKGKAILVPGRSGAGKSTLTEALVHAGATYYSDEFAVLDSRARVRAYPRPLRLRLAPDDPKRKRTSNVAPPEGRLKPVPIGLIVLSEYREGSRWRPHALSPARAVLELMAHTVPVRRKPRHALAALLRATQGAPCLKGVRGEADEAAEAILRLAEV